MSDFYENAKCVLGEANIRKNVPLSTMTTFRVGGMADYVVCPENAGQISALIKLCHDNEIPFFVLGNGSNILASDDGYRGVIIYVLSGMNQITIDGTTVRAQAGAQLIKVAHETAKNGLTGLEFASGIPGTIGGAVYMNAGAYGGEMKDVVRSVTAMDYDGNIYQLACDEMNFSYRHSTVQDRNLIVLSAEFELQTGRQDEIDLKISELAKARKSKQPLEYPSAGSTFKRPEGYFAGKLISDAGLKGFSIGGAQVSEKHSGFVINKGGATADDIMKLICYVKNEVNRQFGVMLETEVKTLGEF